MPRDVAVVTKSAPKQLFISSLILLFCFGLMLLSVGKEAGTTLKRNGTPIAKLETVTTEAELAKGLSGRNELPENKGMLFIFASDVTSTCMWMKDMRFTIDILWLDSDKKVSKILERVSPDTYPESFCSDEAMPYVIELAAGVADANEIVEGTQLTW